MLKESRVVLKVARSWKEAPKGNRRDPAVGKGDVDVSHPDVLRPLIFTYSVYPRTSSG